MTYERYSGGRRVSLHHGDCLDVLPSLEAESVHAIIADLPYGTTACAWDSVIPLEPLWAQFRRVLKERGAVVLFGAQPFTSALVMSNVDWFRYELIWRKTMATGFLDANRRPLRAHENVLVFSEAGYTTYNPQFWYDEPYTRKRQGGSRAEHYGAHERGAISESVDGRRYPVSVMKHSNGNNGSAHPTQKPTDLLEYLVRTYTNEGETVLDCAMGSGTTGVACMNTARDFIGVELEREYFEIAQARIDKAYNAPRQLELL